MKELIKKLQSGEGKLSLLLLEAQEYAEDAQDAELIEFITNELNGYNHGNLPDYRIVKGQIVVTIEDAYGRVVQQNKPIDLTNLSQHLGFDLNSARFPDGIGFIEANIASITGQIAQKPLPFELVKMLNDSFKPNNPSYNISWAAHEFGKAGIEYILVKVRQELVLSLRRIAKKSENGFNESIRIVEPKSSTSVFVTYAWEDEDHNDTIISFVDFLRQKGYEASMDRKESQQQSATNFNQMMIDRIRNSDKVIVVLSKEYKEKAESFSGGVGFEYSIILEQIKTHTNKFIFASLGKYSFKEIVPIGILGREILDLKKDQDENAFNILFAKLNSQNSIEFSDVSDNKPEVKLKEIKPFKL